MKALSLAALILSFVGIYSVQALAGAPLKGVDVKLGRNPGGGASARTDGNGIAHFDSATLQRLAPGRYQFSITGNGRDLSIGGTTLEVSSTPSLDQRQTSSKGEKVKANISLNSGNRTISPTNGSVTAVLDNASTKVEIAYEGEGIKVTVMSNNRETGN